MADELVERAFFDIPGRPVEMGPPAPNLRTPWRIARRRFAANRLAVAGLVTIGVLSLIALLAPFLAPYDPTAIEHVLETRYLAPSWSHPFGTDGFGRDLLSRAIFGARISLSVGVLAMLVAVSLGTLYGAIAGYAGGWIDNGMMRALDAFTAFPKLFLILLLAGVFEADIGVLILIMGLTSWTDTARLIRGEILSLKQRQFVEAAHAIGLPDYLIVWRHLIPNAISSVLVSATLMVGGLIGVEAMLSFLGIGVHPPTPTWGNMIQEGQDALFIAWWIGLFPGLLLSITVLSFNLVSDGLRDALDPKALTRRYV
jgi:peptide/nickel transport system permease protein